MTCNMVIRLCDSKGRKNKLCNKIKRTMGALNANKNVCTVISLKMLSINEFDSKSFENQKKSAKEFIVVLISKWHFLAATNNFQIDQLIVSNQSILRSSILGFTIVL